MSALPALPTPHLADVMALFQIEESIALLYEDIEENGSTAEAEAALDDFLAAAAEKRDRWAGYMKALERMALIAQEEADRYAARAATFANRYDSMKARVLRHMTVHDLKKMEGNRYTFFRKKNAERAHVTKESDTPADCRRLTITVMASDWQALLEHVALETRMDFVKAVLRVQTEVLLTPLKKRLQAGEEIAGAELRQDHHVEVK